MTTNTSLVVSGDSGQTRLINFDRAREALALAHSIDEVKQIRDQASALLAYIKQQKGSFEMQNQAAEIKLRAERRAGEMLKENPDIKPGGDRKSSLHDERMKLADLDISEAQSYRWQLEAEIPEERFEQFISETTAAAEELTSIAAVRIAQKIKREIDKAEAPPLPDGIFDVIYADPPWRYDNQIESWGPVSLHYQDMALEEIMNIAVPAADNAVLFLWATNPFLEDALKVVEAWDFTYKTNLVWVKTELQRPGSGFYIRGRHELLFICTRGAFVPDQTGKEPIGSVIEAPVQEHSRKPDKAYEIIEAIYPSGKYLELFGRGEQRPGWTSWGLEVKHNADP